MHCPLGILRIVWYDLVPLTAKEIYHGNGTDPA